MGDTPSTPPAKPAQPLPVLERKLRASQQRPRRRRSQPQKESPAEAATSNRPELGMRSGNYASVKVGFYGYDTAGNRGVGCGLNGVWITRRGEPLGAAAEPWKETEAEDFSAIAERATAAGKQADDMF
jgi:hypothetical protein